MIKTFQKPLLAAAVTALTLSSAHAGSISGSMDLKVNMPEILVLYHFDEVEINLEAATVSTPANDSDNYEISEGNAGTVTGPMGAPLTGALNIDGSGGPTDGAANQTLEVTLTDAWAIRSVSTGDVTVSGSIQTGTLTHTDDASATIGVGAMELAANGTSGASVTLAPQWGLQKGDISFELDLSSANKAGSYVSAAAADDGTDTFLLTLTGN